MARQPFAPPFRLAGLPVAAKVTLTLFLFLISAGYLAAIANIYERHQDADLEPGLSLNDLKRAYHGLAKQGGGASALVPSVMLKMVQPGGAMRKYLEKGGEPEIRSVISWLEAGAKEEDFSREGVVQAGDPSVEEVIGERCVRCHNAQSGEKKDVPYAASKDSAPRYDLVAKLAVAPRAIAGTGSTIDLEPKGRAALIQSTHSHLLTIPVFALAVGCLFFLTGQRPLIKAVLGPLPMAAICLDIGSWWLARPFEPFIYVIAAAGGIFGASLALQIACVLGSIWLGGRGKAGGLPEVGAARALPAGRD